uniref:Interleukin-17C-like n=1 Tax=Stegastes partitus TaxID=144197 RepID=A0A3B5AJ11_9TELE
LSLSVSPQILLGCLLILPGRSAARCLNATELQRSQQRLERTSWTFPHVTTPQHAPTCAQVAEMLPKDTAGRSLSPWSYRLDRDDNRFPHEIPVAKCLCEGCIINQREDVNYNSKPVFVWRNVLRKEPCPGDPTRVQVSKEKFKVAVACTCVWPENVRR